MCAMHGRGGDKNLFVRKGGVSQKRLGNTDLDDFVDEFDRRH